MEAEKTRIDKWLWAIRVYKSRSLATDAANSGKIKVNGTNVKASKTISIGDEVSIHQGIITKTFKVEKLIDRRVSPKLAEECFKDLTPTEEYLKQKNIMDSSFYRQKGLGRPTKKERRDLNKIIEK